MSVVMPVYNAGGALRQAVASVLAQTFEDFELIVVDDGSTDGAIDDLRRFDDERIRLVRNDANIGAAASRNRALGLAGGQYIAIADSDDLMQPRRLEVQLGRFDEEPDLDLVAGASQVFGDADPVSPVSVPATTHAALTLGLRYGPSFFHGSTMVRRRAMQSVEGYRDLPLTEDYDLYSRLLLSGHRFGAVTDVVLLYRNHPGGISKTRAAEARRVHSETSERLRADVEIPALEDLIASARREPVGWRAEPRLRYLKLLGRTAREHLGGPRRVALRCGVAAACCGLTTWGSLLMHLLRRVAR